jgi:hypothetical protein
MVVTIATYSSPNKSVPELHELIKSGNEIDPLKEFTDAAREELRRHPANPRCGRSSGGEFMLALELLSQIRHAAVGPEICPDHNARRVRGVRSTCRSVLKSFGHHRLG